MPSIRLLSEEVANKIAAGEVVERPAAAVRELIENSLDAGAGQVRVEIASGGLERLSVADDGCGMERGDCLLALERHATSKIFSAADLFRITTLGFRGEALPSLAAVSNLTITSRRKEDLAATVVRVEGGVVREVAEGGRAPGTTVEAADLFFNTPARKKFLSSPAREAALVSECVTRYALAHPGVRFALESGGRGVLRLAPGGRLERLAACLGRQVAEGLIGLPGEGEEALALAPGITLEAHLGPPEMARASTRQALFFLNGRPIRDRLLMHALMRAYEGLTTSGRYPVALMFLEAEPSAVDVNVHPAKAEVRFRDHARLGDALARALRRALERHITRPARTYVLEGRQDLAQFAEPHVAEPQMAFAAPLPLGPAPRPAWAAPQTLAEAGVATAEPEPAAREAQPVEPAAGEPRPEPAAAAPLTLIGQFRASYLICQSGEDLVIVDQHAAHERLLFEELEAAALRGRPALQELLFPAVVELDARQARALEAHAEVLAQAGLIAEPFGGRSAAVKALPQGVPAEEAAALLRDALDGLSGGLSGEPAAREGGLEGRRRALLSLIACKGAVKAGQPLSPEKAQALVSRLAAVRLPYCPHGRPIARRIPAPELARLFKRT